MERGQTLFTIGQFAEIHGVTKKTLMWYDEMGLVKPAVIGENGYRYYSYHQSSTLLSSMGTCCPSRKGKNFPISGI